MLQQYRTISIIWGEMFYVATKGRWQKGKLSKRKYPNFLNLNTAIHLSKSIILAHQVLSAIKAYWMTKLFERCWIFHLLFCSLPKQVNVVSILVPKTEYVYSNRNNRKSTCLIMVAIGFFWWSEKREGYCTAAPEVEVGLCVAYPYNHLVTQCRSFSINATHMATVNRAVTSR